MPRKLNCAVIGVGHMGSFHVRTYANLKTANLKAVVDTNVEQAKKIAKKYNINFYTSVQALIKNEKIDLISVCVPTAYHYSVAKQIIKNKINLLLEKPIADNLKEAKELIFLAQKAKIVFFVGHIERFNPAIVKTKELVKTNILGQISSMIFRRVGGPAPLDPSVDIAIDLAIHDVDISNYLLEEKPKKFSVNKNKICQDNSLSNCRNNSVSILLQYSACTSFIQADWITPLKIRKLLITGTKAYFEIDYLNQQIIIYQNSKQNNYKFKNFKDYVQAFSSYSKDIIKLSKKEPLALEISYVISAILNKKKVDASFAIEALEILI